jgi:hypothetical protein
VQRSGITSISDQTVTLSAVGGVIGVYSGPASPAAALWIEDARRAFFSGSPPPSSYAHSSASSSGLPAWKAARLDPVEARATNESVELWGGRLRFYATGVPKKR